MAGKASVSVRAAVQEFGRLTTVALSATLVAACGGGSDAGTPPTITRQPTDQSVVEGSAATFQVAASGSGTLSYQWSSSSDGTTFSAIAGATGDSYSTGTTSVSQSGTRYLVVVSNGTGSVTSSAVQLTVTHAIAAPVVTVQPTAQVVSAPMAATFNVTATGTSLSYDWQFSTSDGAPFESVPGAANAPSLTLSSTSTAQNGQWYRVTVSNGAGSVTSTAVPLTVNPTPVAPLFTTQPTSQTITAGQSVSFTAAATGTPAPAISWLLDGSSLADGALGAGICSGATVAGATASTLTLTAVPVGCGGAVFSAIASNGTTPDATSNGATLTVNAVPIPPSITSQPANQTVLTGATATFSVVALGSAITYQWLKNGTSIVGATAPTYVTPPVSSVDSGAQYTVTVSNADGSVTSSAAQLNLMLSSNQQTYENLILSGGGSYEFHWNLNLSGAETSGTNYAFSDFAVLAKSPLTNGPQTVIQSAPANLTTTLALINGGPTRVLKNGVILVAPATQSATTISYVGSDIQVDSLASDNATVAFSQIRTGYSAASLTGTLAADSSDFAHWYNSFYSNPAILDPTATYAAGAGYVEYTAINNGDRYDAFDCHAATVDANISPCFVGMTLSDALTAGISSTSDARTYHLNDGIISTVGGVSVWIATAQRPQTATLSTTVEYRIYFELNGNVYTGAFIKDGTVLGGSYYVSNPAGTTKLDQLTFLPFQIRMNRAARDSVAAAMTI